MSTSGHPGVRAAALGLCVVALLALATLQGGGPPAKPSLLLRSPPQRRLQHAGRWFRATVGPCRHAFIDLGTNIGDVMADLMNNAYPQAESKHMRYDPVASEFKLAEGVRTTKLERLISTEMAAFGVTFPETCVVGVEGNPEFTAQLKRLEQVLRRDLTATLDIHTESVVNNEEGKTTLFLDTINPDKHYWGSTLAQTGVNVICGPDAKEKYWKMFKGKSFYDKAENVDCQKAQADVDSVKLSTLMNTYIDPVLAQEGKSLAIIKMDVEGAEYPVLDELVKSGVACAFVKQGNALTIIYEAHYNSLQGAFEQFRGDVYRRNIRALRACGVKLFEGERLASSF
mmetsp:Transcript_2396/g.10193  ORF Transcript_2396/g.10193 Transcript_2396/m.10193 type:complete len:342 (-) Transcript_2396:298-1323(-)